MSSPNQCSAIALMPSFLTAAAYASILQAAVNKDSIRRFVTRLQPKHLLSRARFFFWKSIVQAVLTQPSSPDIDGIQSLPGQNVPKC